MIYRQSSFSTPILPVTSLVDPMEAAQLHEQEMQRQFLQCLTSTPMLSLLLSLVPQSHSSSLHAFALTLLIHLGWRLTPLGRKTLGSDKQLIVTQLMNAFKSIPVEASSITAITYPHTFSLLFFNPYDTEMRLHPLRASLLVWFPKCLISFFFSLIVIEQATKGNVSALHCVFSLARTLTQQSILDQIAKNSVYSWNVRNQCDDVFLLISQLFQVESVVAYLVNTDGLGEVVSILKQTSLYPLRMSECILEVLVIEPFLQILRTIQSMAVTAETLEPEIGHLAREHHTFLLAAGKDEKSIIEEKLRTAGIHLVNGENGYITCSENGENGERVLIPDKYIIVFPRELADVIVDRSVVTSLLKSEVHPEWMVYVVNSAQYNTEYREGTKGDL